MDVRELCISLLKSDSEEEVVELLRAAGYWDDRDAWRYFGDVENNWSTIGNQQSSPYASLVEKLVNSVDATLMGKCYENGYDPDGQEAPQTMRTAVSRFFEDDTPEDAPHAGLIRNWSSARRTEVALGITLVATGSKKNPCFTIADQGEGQTPDLMPDTLLSLAKTNKMRIPFVQGKHNMGGTGVFKFCGERNLQLVISKRNPAALKGYSSDGSKWSFSIVRREEPERDRRSSVFTYLAPLGKDSSPGRGGVLRFAADELPIFPEFSSSTGQNPYLRMAGWGTLIKLYEYSLPSGGRSNILQRDGLMRRLDLLLPDTALPIRFFEGRDFGGKPGSYANTLTGLSVRLDDDKASNLEEGFPTSCPLRADDEEMTATIYAFRKGKAKTYRNDEGIIFTQNGQTHGHLTPDFFRRKRVGLSYLADSLLVVVDCSRFRGRAREDLFMNSRDRLSKGNLRISVEHELEDMLKNHAGLRELKERRRREETEERLADSKPLEEILDNILKQAPSLANLFLLGKRASNPFKTKSVIEKEQPFEGKRFPSYFKFKGKDYGTELIRETHINHRSRINFETDTVNDFFSRPMEAGSFSLYQLLNDKPKQPVSSFAGPNLHNGIATLSIKLPEDVAVGDSVRFEAIVTDPYNDREFVNRFNVLVKEEASPTGSSGGRRKPPGKDDGKGRENQAGIVLPNIVDVTESDWAEYDFDKHTALTIRDSGETDTEGNGDTPTQYDFFINMDNVYLKSELKSYKSNVNLLKARFRWGLVLVGLGLLHQYAENTRAKPSEDDDDDERVVNIERRIADTSRAIAPIILPMIDSLGSLDPAQVEAATASGEDV